MPYKLWKRKQNFCNLKIHTIHIFIEKIVSAFAFIHMHICNGATDEAKHIMAACGIETKKNQQKPRSAMKCAQKCHKNDKTHLKWTWHRVVSFCQQTPCKNNADLFVLHCVCDCLTFFCTCCCYNIWSSHYVSKIGETHRVCSCVHLFQSYFIHHTTSCIPMNRIKSLS